MVTEGDYELPTNDNPLGTYGVSAVAADITDQRPGGLHQGHEF